MSKIFEIENLRNYYKKKISAIDKQLEDMREKREQLQKERGAWEQIKKIELGAIQSESVNTEKYQGAKKCLHKDLIEVDTALNLSMPNYVFQCECCGAKVSSRIIHREVQNILQAVSKI